jgi:hypothetical protein
VLQKRFYKLCTIGHEAVTFWGWNKICSQTYGNVVRSKNVGQGTDRKTSARAEFGLDLDLQTLIQG